MSKPFTDDELILKDWEMTKDRIKHFDDAVIKLRTEGIPIAVAIQGGAWAALNYTKDLRIPILCWNPTVVSIVFLLGFFYLLGIGMLDALHFHLLRIAVRHGRGIERLPQFKDKLLITTKLTGKGLTLVHFIGALITYVVVELMFLASFFITM